MDHQPPEFTVDEAELKRVIRNKAKELEYKLNVIPSAPTEALATLHEVEKESREFGLWLANRLQVLMLDTPKPAPARDLHSVAE